eukprot:CAMPEP_0195335904 /NCGR_PEP_ID=MMETSP0708-20121125/15878_1 /TAXON_ID=33640 /ORGANISM="Asterionellopsis glacialis, Strain CCMP134" /LENGTH=35 /DNA_ID= /DNA_START= /DNA_END= /DNA_ORIENTATION=
MPNALSMASYMVSASTSLLPGGVYQVGIAARRIAS